MLHRSGPSIQMWRGLGAPSRRQKDIGDATETLTNAPLAAAIALTGVEREHHKTNSWWAGVPRPHRVIRRFWSSPARAPDDVPEEALSNRITAHRRACMEMPRGGNHEQGGMRDLGRPPPPGRFSGLLPARGWVLVTCAVDLSAAGSVTRTPPGGGEVWRSL